MPHISLQMYTLRDFTKTLEEVKNTYHKVADIGYRYVQPILPSFMTADEFGALLSECNLKADSFSYGGADIVDKLDDMKRIGDALETKYIRGASISKEESYTKETFKRAAAEMQKRALAAKNAGMVYLYHFHAYEFVDFGDCNGMEILLNEAPDLQFQPDVHWIAAAGYEPSSALYMFKDRAPYLHMQGYAIHPDPEQKRNICDATVPVGQGALNWKGIVEAGKAMNVELYVAEQDYCYVEHFESVRQCFEGLRKLGIDP